MTNRAEFERLLDVYGFRCERFGQDLSTHARAQVVSAFAALASAPVAEDDEVQRIKDRGPAYPYTPNTAPPTPLASAPVAGEAVSVDVYVYRQDNRYLATALLPIDTPLRPGLNTLYAAPQASAEKDAAVRTLTAKGYTWHGGEQWKPPLGDSNATLARLDASDALEVARAALMEIADLADVEADQRSVIVNQALTKIAKMTAGPQADKDGAVDESRNLQGNPVDRSAELQGDKDGGQQRAGDVDERAVLDVVRAALPEFRQQDDYLLAHGASLMSENSHEIIHIDTLRRVISAALSAPQAEQGERDE